MPETTTKTTTETKPMTLAEAKLFAGELVDAMRPYCLRVEVAGSTRREKPSGIKDIEIVAVPRWEQRPAQTPADSLALFDDAPEMVWYNTLHEWAIRNSKSGPVGIPDKGVCWVKPRQDEETGAWLPSVPNEGGKFWKGILRDGAMLDLFLTTTERWGATFLLRTGSSEFSTEVARRAQQGHHYRFGKGGLCKWYADEKEKFAQLVETPEEDDVFRLLRLAPVPPIERTGIEAVKWFDWSSKEAKRS